MLQLLDISLLADYALAPAVSSNSCTPVYLTQIETLPREIII